MARQATPPTTTPTPADTTADTPAETAATPDAPPPAPAPPEPAAPTRCEPVRGADGVAADLLPPCGGCWLREADGGLRPADAGTAHAAGLAWLD